MNRRVLLLALVLSVGMMGVASAQTGVDGSNPSIIEEFDLVEVNEEQSDVEVIVADYTTNEATIRIENVDTTEPLQAWASIPGWVGVDLEDGILFHNDDPVDVSEEDGEYYAEIEDPNETVYVTFKTWSALNSGPTQSDVVVEQNQVEAQGDGDVMVSGIETSTETDETDGKLSIEVEAPSSDETHQILLKKTWVEDSVDVEMAGVYLDGHPVDWGVVEHDGEEWISLDVDGFSTREVVISSESGELSPTSGGNISGIFEIQQIMWLVGGSVVLFFGILFLWYRRSQDYTYMSP